MLDELSLDKFGRVILDDRIMVLLDYDEEQTLSGGSNYRCGGTANGGCTNTRCEGTFNGSCTNQMHCTNSANLTSCQSPVAEVPTNSGCA